MRKTFFLIGVLVLTSTTLALAQTNQVTLTTYYPAPFGMYQQMRVMGRLGVGTANPTYTAEIHGAQGSAMGAGILSLRASDTTSGMEMGVQSGRAFIQAATGYPTPTAARVVAINPSGGNVGIGTTAPNESLEVAGNIHVSGADRTIFNRTNHSLAFGTNNTVRMTILSGGLVGIGTINPGEKLSVDGNVLLEGENRMVRANDGETSLGASITLEQGVASQGGGLVLQGGSGMTGGNLLLKAGQVAFGSPEIFGRVEIVTDDNARLTVLKDGRVGIGTSTPTANLQVIGSIKKNEQEVLVPSNLSVIVYVNDKNCAPGLPANALTTVGSCGGGGASCVNAPGATCLDILEESQCFDTPICSWDPLFVPSCSGTLKCNDHAGEGACNLSPSVCYWNVPPINNNTPVGRMHSYGL